MNPLLSLRRHKLALQCDTKLISCPQNLTHNCIMEIRFKNLLENKAKTIKPLNLRIQNHLNKIKIMHDTILLKTALWVINQPIVKPEQTKSSRSKTHAITF